MLTLQLPQSLSKHGDIFCKNINPNAKVPRQCHKRITYYCRNDYLSELVAFLEPCVRLQEKCLQNRHFEITLVCLSHISTVKAAESLGTGTKVSPAGKWFVGDEQKFVYFSGRYLPAGLTFVLIRECAAWFDLHFYLKDLQLFFNYWLIPRCWKCAKVTTLFKQGSSSDI